LLDELELELPDHQSELVLVDVFVEVFVLVLPAMAAPLDIARAVAKQRAGIRTFLTSHSPNPSMLDPSEPNLNGA
jgi:hypothetical protein